jgi:hypothetical protein
VRVDGGVSPGDGGASDADAFEHGLINNDPEIAPSQVYAYAALMSGVPFANGAPNLTHDIPALLGLARDRNIPVCGKDFKTGQTFMKTLLAPGLKSRMLGCSAGSRRTFLGNRDGEVLEDPGSFKTKEETKLSVLDQILQPDLYPGACTRTCITRCDQLLSAARGRRRRVGTTSTSSGGWAIRCRSRSIFCAGIRFWRRRWCWTWCCSWTWRSGRG